MEWVSLSLSPTAQGGIHDGSILFAVVTRDLYRSKAMEASILKQTVIVGICDEARLYGGVAMLLENGWNLGVGVHSQRL